VDSLPSMSPDSQSFAPIEAYEKGLHYADYHSPSPGYTSPSPLGGLSSPGYSSPPPLTIYRSPSLDYSPPQFSVSDVQIQSSMGLNFEDSDILAALADQNYTLIAPESELLQICDAVSDVNHRFSSPVFDLEMYDESPSPLDSYVQEVPQDYKEHDQAVLEESDPILLEDQQNIWMRNILEELMIAPELLSPVSSDDVDSVLSGDSLTSAHQPLQRSFPDKQNFELSASSPVLPVSPNFLSIVDMNPSSYESSATSSYDGCGESVLLLSSGYEYKAVSLSHYRSEGPYARPDRRILKKEQNKTAALRYRHKKREQKGVVLTEVEQLELRNEELKNHAADLTREINYLKGLMEEICKT